MAALLIQIAWGYSAVGAVVAAAFLTIGIGRVSQDAAGSYAFRPLLIPGIILLWPVVLVRWWQLERGARWGGAQHKPPRVAQHGAAVGLMILIPVIVLGSFLIRQDGPHEAAPMRLDAETAEGGQ